MQRRCKHAFAATERLSFSVWSVSRGYKKDKENRLSYLSFETPDCQDMRMAAEELELRVSGVGSWQNNDKKRN
jgi:hypothetical protein